MKLENMFIIYYQVNIFLKPTGQAWWLMPVILALQEAKAGGLLEVRSLRPAWATWWNPISTTNTKISWTWLVHVCNPSYLRGWGRRITWTQEGEVVVSQDHAIALQLGQQERNSISKKKEIQKLSRRGGAHLYSQLFRWLRQKKHLNPGGGGCSEQRLCYRTQAWATRVKFCLKKKKQGDSIYF